LLYHIITLSHIKDPLHTGKKIGLQISRRLTILLQL